MTKFERAYVPESEIEIVVKDVFQKWTDNNPEIRQMIDTTQPEIAHARITAQVRELVYEDEIWKNDVYQVNVRHVSRVDRGMIHLSIKRIDRQPCHDWRDMQAIKNELIGPECEGVELYPAESRLVDQACQYHIWCCPDPAYRFPFGFAGGRFVSDIPIGKSHQRPFPKTV